TKLFLVFLATTTVVVISMLLITRWSIEHGFVQYVEKRQASEISRISDRLLDTYLEDGGWQALAADKRRWLLILFGRDVNQTVFRQPEWRESEHMHHMMPPRRRMLRFLSDNSPDWPPDRSIRQLERVDRPLPLAMRLMLFDADSRPVFGRQDMLQKSQQFPLELNDSKVGFLALIPGPSLTETGEIHFLEQQHSVLLWIALGIVLFSAFISMLLAKRLVKPVSAFRTATNKLAGGQYATRVNVEGQDELGQLATDINALAQSLQAHEQSRQQWVADIAHELRTPLTVIRGELEALQDGVRALDSKAVESLLADTLRLGRLVDDLYQLSMTDSGALSYRKERCMPVAILKDDIDSLADRFDTAGIELTTDFDKALDVVMQADIQRLSQMYRNILQNTLRYTDTGGQLVIQVREDDQDVVIDFQDSNPGVKGQDMSKLFDRLYRVEMSRNRELGGAGLGLAIVKNIVVAHNGEINALESPFGGLWLQIRFPLVETDK
ncbi:MAG: HAMP domain-containing protein, partial [Gammaproteobacteria bacterium]